MATARKLSRKKDNRQLLQRNLLTSLVLNGRLITTTAKAKSIKPLAEKLFVQARSTSLADRRRAAETLTTNHAGAKLMTVAKQIPVQSGVIRLVRTAPRLGDNAPQTAVIIRQRSTEAKTKAKEAKS